MEGNQNRKRHKVPLEIYHGIPKGWTQEEIISKWTNLNGRYDISGPPETEPGAPSFLPDRENWLQYRITLYRVCHGIKAHDLACIEIAIQYIRLNYIGSYSGYIRDKMARALKNAPISVQQKAQLENHILELVKEKNYSQEFKQYRKLYEKISEKDLF